MGSEQNQSENPDNQGLSLKQIAARENQRLKDILEQERKNLDEKNFGEIRKEIGQLKQLQSQLVEFKQEFSNAYGEGSRAAESLQCRYENLKSFFDNPENKTILGFENIENFPKFLDDERFKNTPDVDEYRKSQEEVQKLKPVTKKIKAVKKAAEKKGIVLDEQEEKGLSKNAVETEEKPSYSRLVERRKSKVEKIIDALVDKTEKKIKELKLKTPEGRQEALEEKKREIMEEFENGQSGFTFAGNEIAIKDELLDKIIADKTGLYGKIAEEFIAKKVESQMDYKYGAFGAFRKAEKNWPELQAKFKKTKEKYVKLVEDLAEFFRSNPEKAKKITEKLTEYSGLYITNLTKDYSKGSLVSEMSKWVSKNEENIILAEYLLSYYLVGNDAYSDKYIKLFIQKLEKERDINPNSFFDFDAAMGKLSLFEEKYDELRKKFLDQDLVYNMDGKQFGKDVRDSISFVNGKEWKPYMDNFAINPFENEPNAEVNYQRAAEYYEKIKAVELERTDLNIENRKLQLTKNDLQKTENEDSALRNKAYKVEYGIEKLRELRGEAVKKGNPEIAISKCPEGFEYFEKYGLDIFGNQTYIFESKGLEKLVADGKALEDEIKNIKKNIEEKGKPEYGEAIKKGWFGIKYKTKLNKQERQKVDYEINSLRDKIPVLERKIKDTKSNFEKLNVYSQYISRIFFPSYYGENDKHQKEVNEFIKSLEFSQAVEKLRAGTGMKLQDFLAEIEAGMIQKLEALKKTPEYVAVMKRQAVREKIPEFEKSLNDKKRVFADKYAKVTGIHN